MIRWGLSLRRPVSDQDVGHDGEIDADSDDGQKELSHNELISQSYKKAK